MKQSFLDLTKSENLYRIKIDSRLINAFISVMKKMQYYFDAYDLESAKDYKKFFEDYLLDKDFSIVINDKPIVTNSACLYSKEDNSIIISSSIYENYESKATNEEIEHAIFNGFLHFIIMHDLNVENCSEEIYDNGFITEGLIESLTLQNYRNMGLYSPQVRMVEFANLLSNKTNNYRLLLQGKIDTKQYGSGWHNFYLSASKYHEEFKEYNEDIYNAMLNSDYKKAQRYLIESFYTPSKITSIDEYFEMCNKLDKRVVRDESYIDNFIAKCENGLINNLVGKDKKVHDIYESLFDEYHDTLKKAKRYGSKYVYSFDFEDYHLVVDPDGIDQELFFDRNGKKTNKSINGRILTYTVNDKSIDLNLEELPYINYEEKRDFLIKKMRSNLRIQSRSDIEAIKEVASSPKQLIKLERFTLPNIGYEKRKEKDVYIAYYNTGIEVLTDYPSIKEVEGINIDKYEGITTISSSSLIKRKSVVTNASGIMYSTASKDYVHNKVMSTIEKLIKSSLQPSELELIYESYKKSEEYCKNDNIELEKNDSILWYASTRFYSLQEEEREKLINNIINACDKFIVTTINGVVCVCKMVSECEAYIAEKETLVDSRMQSLYNKYFDINKNKEEDKESEILKIAEGSLQRPENASNLEESSGNEIINILEKTTTIDTDEIKKKLA